MELIEKIAEWYSAGGRSTLLRITYYLLLITFGLGALALAIIAIICFCWEMALVGVLILLSVPIELILRVLILGLLQGEVQFSDQTLVANKSAASVIKHSNSTNHLSSTNLERATATQYLREGFASTECSNFATSEFSLYLYKEGIDFCTLMDNKHYFIDVKNIGEMETIDKALKIYLKSGQTITIPLKGKITGNESLIYYQEYLNSLK